MVVTHFRDPESWMTNYVYFDAWIIHFAGFKYDIDLGCNTSEKIICHFWNKFFNKLLVNNHIQDSQSVDVDTNTLVDYDTRIIKVSHSIFVK